ncbi:MAG: HdeD family acid-resistance protein [Hyphomicrobiaceae bacterium]
MAQSIQTPEALKPAELSSKLRAAVHDHWLLFLSEGIALVALGFAAVAVPPLASLAVTIFLGWLLLAAGAVGFISTLAARNMPGFWWAMFSSVLALATGGILLYEPLRGVLTLTLVLGAYFVADGVASIMLAIDHRKDDSRSWGWLIASGVVDFVLAGIILSGWPGTSAWAIGLIVGIDLVFAGFALAMMALRARKDIA